MIIYFDFNSVNLEYDTVNWIFTHNVINSNKRPHFHWYLFRLLELKSVIPNFITGWFLWNGLANLKYFLSSLTYIQYNLYSIIVSHQRFIKQTRVKLPINIKVYSLLHSMQQNIIICKWEQECTTNMLYFLLHADVSLLKWNPNGKYEPCLDSNFCRHSYHYFYIK